MYRREDSDNRMLSRLPELCPPGRGEADGRQEKGGRQRLMMVLSSVFYPIIVVLSIFFITFAP